LVYTSNERSNYELRTMVHHLTLLFGEAWHRHNLVSLRVDSVARVLYDADLYKRIVDVPGVIC